MASFYSITLPNGTPLGNVADLTVNTTLTSIGLIGRGASVYGGAVANDWVAMLCNFANSSAPANQLTGQLWYNSTTNSLNFYNGSSWVPLLAAAGTTTPGTYTSVIVNANGEVTSGSLLQQADIVALLGYTPISGVTITGDVIGIATGSTIAVALADVGSAGTYSTVVTDANGRVISGSTITAATIETALGYVPSPPITTVAGTYDKVAVNAAGQVVSGLALASSDIVAALGYVPSSVVGAGTLQVVTTAGATTSNAIAITNATPSIDKTTGALTLGGGLGVLGDIHTGGNMVAGGAILASNGISSTNGSFAAFGSGTKVFEFTNAAGTTQTGVVYQNGTGPICINAGGGNVTIDGGGNLVSFGNITASGGSVHVQDPATGWVGGIYQVSDGLNFGSGFPINSGYMWLDPAGNVTATAFNATSDATLKTNVETVTDALTMVTAMRGVSFDLISDGSSSYGVIAQELQIVAPKLVSSRVPVASPAPASDSTKPSTSATTPSPMAAAASAGTPILSVNYNGLHGILIEAIKELAATVGSLTAEVAALKAGKAA